MDRGLVVMSVASICMLAFFVGYQLFAVDLSGSDGGDDSWKFNVVDITLKGDSLEVSSSRSATVSGSKVTITSPGIYNIAGSLTDGQIIVSSQDEGPVKLVLKGVNINCSSSSPICISDAEKVLISLEAGTDNFVCDGYTYVFADPNANEPNAAIFSKSDLTITGSGLLNVIGNFNDGIAGKDGLVIESGTIHVRSVDDGIRGKDYIIVKGGTIALDVSGDGLKSDNAVNATLGYVSVENGTINITSGGDAFQAENYVSISAGSFNLKSGGGNNAVVSGNFSSKGIKGLVAVRIDEGVFVIDSADDAIHSNGTVTVNGGSFVLSSGDDAIHADGAVNIGSGDINIAKSFEGVEGSVVTISNGDLQIVSTNDGIDAVANLENSTSGIVSVLNGRIAIISGEDAIQAGKDIVIAGGDFTLTSGGGSANIVAAGDSAKGLKSISRVVVNNGTFTINSADDAVNSNGSITINGGTYSISTRDDGFHADSSIAITGGIIDISSGGDAVQAQTSVLITAGRLNLVSGGGSNVLLGADVSAKGIKGVSSVTVNEGDFVIDSADDAIHSNGIVTINGGSFELVSGDETIYAEGSVQVNGGRIDILNSSGDSGDMPWDSSTVVDVKLSGNSIGVSNSRPAVASGSTLTIRYAGIYRITGSLSDGQIIVNTKDPGVVKLILNGAHISCSSNAPISVLDAGQVIVFLEASTENSVADGASYVFASSGADEPNAAIYCRSDLIIAGTGALTVSGNYNDGIASKDGLVVESGSIVVNSVDDGIRGKDYVVVKGGSLSLNVGGDGIKSDNVNDTALGYVTVEDGTIVIQCKGDAIQAETKVLVTGGTFNIVSGGGSSGSSAVSAKGIKGITGVTIETGVLTINSADDAIHSNGHISINGGSLVLSTGDDAIHADSSININNGDIKIMKSYEGIESDLVTINNGTIHVVSSDDGVNIGADTGFPGPGIGAGPGLSTYTGSYYLYINNGYLMVNALGDGIDSNGAFIMTGGIVIIDGPSSDMNSALDHVAFNITSGYLVAAGSSGMALPPGNLSAQYSVMLNFRTANQAGTLVHVQTSSGTEVFTFAPTKRYQSVVFSMPSLALGTSYDVYIGGSHTGTVTDGLYSGGTYTPGTKYISFTISNKVTRLGPSGGFFPPFP